MSTKDILEFFNVVQEHDKPIECQFRISNECRDCGNDKGLWWVPNGIPNNPGNIYCPRCCKMTSLSNNDISLCWDTTTERYFANGY